ncbi:putative late blight resistance protein homolog R1A-3 [Salvia splendens]|uniref:putative late blight resistance protein homolog R1A-3 n=1 Tax=Salvia splendens TaxID=180675 RepID=UPI001C271E8B|nr:putative late blight resistance protein homolog R1A-3 [Salvia splendens]
MEDKKKLPELDSFMEQVKLVEMEDKKMLSSTSSTSVVVGIDEDLMQLKDRLIGQQQKKLEIVPIVGMGGIADIWSTKFWDEIRMCFLDNNNGSRIVITTRESDVANYADYSSLKHPVQLLSEFESWNLLHQLVFVEEECPPELQDIGRKIANGCSGLPLAIAVIGGLLSMIKRSEDGWEKIGNNVIAAIARNAIVFCL